MMWGHKIQCMTEASPEQEKRAGGRLARDWIRQRMEEPSSESESPGGTALKGRSQNWRPGLEPRIARRGP